MIPLGASIPTRRQPIATLSIVAVCALVFVYELTLRGQQLDLFVERWGAAPRAVLAALSGNPQVPRTVLLTLFTSQFIHAGFLHVGGNMLFLWVFGRAVEDRLGPALYLVLYLAAGALAGLAQSVVEGPGSSVPLIGASGAIAAVLGMYLVSYPRAWVTVLMPVLFFFWTFDLPAIAVLGFWFVTQFFNGVAAVTQASRATADAGVAVWAHVAGFLIGALAAPLLPHGAASGPAPARSPAGRQGNVPGAARLVSSVADLAALLLAARLLLLFLGLTTARSPVAGFAALILAATSPIVEPLRGVIPSLRVAGTILETASLVAIVVVYLLAGLVGQMVVRK